MDDFQAYKPCNETPWNDRIIRARNATIEEISIYDRTGYVTISYRIKGDFNMIQNEVVTLIVNQATIITDPYGRKLLFRDLREGMLVNAEFSSVMTRSIPPQTNAYRITVLS